MGARILDGRALAAAQNEKTRAAVGAHRAAAGRPPRLAILLVGEDEASAIYVRRKTGAAREVGVETRVERLGTDAGDEAVAARLAAFGEDPEVDGVVLQLPLPAPLDARALFRRIPVAKDVDGLNPVSQGLLLQGQPDALVPATPLAVRWLIAAAGVEPKGTHVVVVSHSNLIGKPLAALLVNEDATVTVCHKHTRDLAAHTRRADLLVTAAGVPGLITAAHVQEGAVVIDAAIVRGSGGRLVGDCAADVAARAGVLTPVPGGVGPVTVAALLANTALAWRRRTDAR